MNACSSPSGPDHYELSLPATGISCLPTTVTVTACADGSSPCTNPYRDASGHTATLATSAGTLGATTLGFNALGIATTTLSHPAAVDGAVAEGASSLDQSPITGEFVPVDVTDGDVVFAGSLNVQGTLLIRATKRADDSTLSRIAALVGISRAQYIGVRHRRSHPAKARA